MNSPLYINNSVVIRNSKVFRNGELIFETEQDEKIGVFLKNIYKKLDHKYPRFFKMDKLSKLGYLGMEILIQGEINDKNTALIFGNSASSLDTDEEYFESMKEFPSPSLFVYTLPNIVLGEISIRHKLRSENMFIILEKFDPGLFVDHAETLFREGKADNIVCGWVDLHNNDYDVFLWHIARHGRYDFNEEELKKLYLPTHE